MIASLFSMNLTGALLFAIAEDEYNALLAGEDPTVTSATSEERRRAVATLAPVLGRVEYARQ